MKLATTDAPYGIGINDGRPQLGEWVWLKPMGQDASKEEEAGEEFLACVAKLASNHVRFERCYGEHGSNYWRIKNEDLLACTRPAPDWREVLDAEMREITGEMADLSRQLMDQSIKASALPDPNAAPFEFTPETSMVPALRVLDPDRQKAALVAVRENIPIVQESMKRLAERFAGVAKSLMLPEHIRLKGMVRDLGVLEDKIFTIEVYAGMQEIVHQIAEGQPAGVGEKIAIRQSFLFMDEETLIDYDKGGMDFTKIEDFDAWVAQPENIKRCLPEPRGIVAFRIRRNEKDYGPVRSIWQAFAHAEWARENLKTYLVIRNGENIYRIASEVEFWPRLIPLRSEFDDAFTERHTRYKYIKKKGDPFARKEWEEVEHFGPDHLEYDDKANALRRHLIHYNRIVILLQGLLDRSEVFHPHVPVDLTNARSFEEWIKLVRDDEDALELSSPESPLEYIERINLDLKPGDLIWSNYPDMRERGNGSKDRPYLMRIKKIRGGKLTDIQKYRKRTDRGYSYWTQYEKEKDVLGVRGVEVEWLARTWVNRQMGRSWARYSQEVPARVMARQWIPMHALINVMGYKPGDYKQFIENRRNREEYLKWVAPMFMCEDYHQKRIKEETEEK